MDEDDDQHFRSAPMSDLIKREIPEEFVEAYRVAIERTA